MFVLFLLSPLANLGARRWTTQSCILVVHSVHPLVNLSCGIELAERVSDPLNIVENLHFEQKTCIYLAKRPLLLKTCTVWKTCIVSFRILLTLGLALKFRLQDAFFNLQLRRAFDNIFR